MNCYFPAPSPSSSPLPSWALVALLACAVPPRALSWTSETLADDVARLRDDILAPLRPPSSAADRRLRDQTFATYDPAWPFLLPPLVQSVAHGPLREDGGDIDSDNDGDDLPGFFVVDGLVGAGVAAAARAEAERLLRAGLLVPETTNGRGDLVYWEDETREWRDDAPALREVVTALELVGRLFAAADRSSPSSARQLDSRTRALLTAYGEGIGYGPHFDNPFSVLTHDPRLVTLLYYLNPASEWGLKELDRGNDEDEDEDADAGSGEDDKGRHGRGGQLRIEAAQSSTASAATRARNGSVVDAAPIADRWLLLDATRVRHEVIPVRPVSAFKTSNNSSSCSTTTTTTTTSMRFAMTIWLTRSSLERTANGECIACHRLWPHEEQMATDSIHPT